MQLAPDEVTNSEVRGWKGIHLLHFQGSSCSQKVRILLSEKGIPWQSHPVDLARHKHVSPWFLGINPRGVVPVLVHDGVVHVESNDIMKYLDGLPSGAAPFFPRNDAERRWVRESLDLEDGMHMDLRNITMGFLVPDALARKSPETLDAYERDGRPDPKRDREVAWWRDFAAQGVTEGQARASAAAYAAAFEQLEKRLADHAGLADHSWLLGDRISVLEIAWFISIHRLARAGYPLERHPRLQAHYARLLERPAFAAEVESRGLPGLVFRFYGAYRRATGRTLRHVLESA